MTTIASGVNKLVTFKRQPGLGQAAGTGTGQNLRRTTSNLDLKKATYQSSEIRPSQQRADFRHGVRSVDGTVSGELSVATHQQFFEAILRQRVVSAVSVVGAAGDIVSASTGTNTGTLTATTASFLTGNKFKIGMVVRASGFTTTATANNAANMMITNLTDKVMTVCRLDGQPVVAKTETAAVTITSVGKHTYVPQTGHTRDYFTFEHNFQDIVQAEQFTDCVIDQADIKLPPTGMATVDFGVKGLNMTTSTAGYFVSPTPVTTGSSLAASNGVLYLNGVAVGLVTGLNVTVKGNYNVIGGVVGSNVDPDILPGVIEVSGQATVLFTDATIRDYFVNEVEVSLYAAFTASNAANADFVAISLPRVKMGGAGKDDGEKGLVLTAPFTALECIAGGSGQTNFQTVMAIQDSQYV
jgi:hypothetical protein